MGQRTIGIDLAIRGDHVARIFDDGRPHAKPIRFRLTSESLSSLVARLRERLPADSTITAVMEPTGMSWFPVARWLERAGIKAIRVKGQRVRALRRYLSEHTKTDAADAYVLGAIPWFGGVPVDPVYVPNADRHALQRLTRQRERLEDEVSTIKRRLIDLVRWACPAIEATIEVRCSSWAWRDNNSWTLPSNEFWSSNCRLVTRSSWACASARRSS